MEKENIASSNANGFLKFLQCIMTRDPEIILEY